MLTSQASENRTTLLRLSNICLYDTFPHGKKQSPIAIICCEDDQKSSPSVRIISLISSHGRFLFYAQISSIFKRWFTNIQDSLKNCQNLWRKPARSGNGELSAYNNLLSLATVVGNRRAARSCRCGVARLHPQSSCRDVLRNQSGINGTTPTRPRGPQQRTVEGNDQTPASGMGLV